MPDCRPMTIAHPHPELPREPTSVFEAPTKSLKIALLGYRSAPHVGGQGIYIKYLAAALVRAGHQVDVYSGPPYPELEVGARLIKVPSLDLYACDNHVTALRWQHLRSFSDTYEWWTMLTGGFAEPYTFGRRLEKYLSPGDYDIIHDNQSLCYGLLNLQNRGAKVVATIHHPIHRDRELALAEQNDWGMRLLVKRWYSFLRMQERVVRGLEHIVTVSRCSQRDIATHFQLRGEVSVITNGIDINTFKPLAAIRKQPLRLITTASSDQPLKGLRYLLLALNRLRQQWPAIELRIIGKLSDNSPNRKLIDKLELATHVSFVSGISSEDLAAEYNRASVAVCPSLYEGFGLPAGEAMACGLPVVSTNGGALPEVVGDAGVIVPAGDAEALAAAIHNLLDSPDHAKALGVRARQRIETHFCWDAVARQLTQYYQRVITSTC